MPQRSHLRKRTASLIALAMIGLALATLKHSHASASDSGDTFNQTSNFFSNVSNPLTENVAPPVYRIDQIYQPPLPGPEIYNQGFYGPGGVINNAGQFIVTGHYIDPQGGGCSANDDFSRAIIYYALTPTIIEPTYSSLDTPFCLPHDSRYENIAVSINAAGQVIGYERGRDVQTSTLGGFLYSNGTKIALNSLITDGSSLEIIPIAINNSGQIVFHPGDTGRSALLARMASVAQTL